MRDVLPARQRLVYCRVLARAAGMKKRSEHSFYLAYRSRTYITPPSPESYVHVQLLRLRLLARLHQVGPAACVFGLLLQDDRTFQPASTEQVYVQLSA